MKYSGFEGLSFGIMEGLIMITGMLIGFGLSYPEKEVILLAVLTAAFADAFANSVAFHVSVETKKGASHTYALRASGLCFIATFFATVVPVFPLLFLPVGTGVVVGGVLALILMAALSKFVAQISGRRAWPVILEYLLYGIGAAFLCYAAGHVISIALL